MDPGLDELQRELATGVGEDHQLVRISSVNFDPEFSMTISLSADEYLEPRDSTWIVTSTTLLACRIGDPQQDALQITEDHPVLWEFSERAGALYFRLPPKNPKAAVADLVQCHLRLCDHWIDMDRFMRSGMWIEDLLKAGNGLIARGPKPLLEAYLPVLAEHGCEPYINWPNAPVQPSCALVFCDSFVVATSLTATRQVS